MRESRKVGREGNRRSRATEHRPGGSCASTRTSYAYASYALRVALDISRGGGRRALNTCIGACARKQGNGWAKGCRMTTCA